MPGLPESKYVEVRDGHLYYVAGSRIGLDVLVHDFRRGKTAEAILQSYPSIGPLSRVYGAIAFILEHPEAIDSYMREQDARWYCISLQTGINRAGRCRLRPKRRRAPRCWQRGLTLHSLVGYRCWRQNALLGGHARWPGDRRAYYSQSIFGLDKTDHVISGFNDTM